MVYGSKARAISLSDGIATLRDAAILIVAAIGNYFVDGGLGQEVEMAIVVVTFAVVKFAWKFFTDTQRIQPL